MDKKPKHSANWHRRKAIKLAIELAGKIDCDDDCRMEPVPREYAKPARKILKHWKNSKA